jgi:hypothetical protein
VRILHNQGGANVTYFISESAIYASRPLFTRTNASLHTLVNMSPPNTTQLVHQEGRIALAIEAFNQGYFTSIRAAARSYDVPRSTLQDRINKHPARRDLRPANCKLTETEELTLVQWILSIDERGLLPRSDTVQQMANLLLQKRSGNQGNTLTVGKL